MKIIITIKFFGDFQKSLLDVKKLIEILDRLVWEIGCGKGFFRSSSKKI